MKKNTTVPVFFCIPDLSGFTKFITTADTDFANKVIPTLLNKIVSANILGMNVAEIEGDAVFFYRNGRLPAIGKVAQQCRLIYDLFNETIENFKLSDPINYEKYLASSQLGIKIIIHYGKITLTNITGQTKLLGEDVILVHKLLKNSISEHNYILLSHKYTEKLKDKKAVKTWFNWQSLKRGSDEYEHFGQTHYSYIPFGDCTNFMKKKLQLLKS